MAKSVLNDRSDQLNWMCDLANINMSGNHSSKTVPNIGIIGAGISGICAAIQLEKKLNITSYTLFEKNADIGGTWFNNVYPGCACDVASHFYSFSFELNPYWSSNYPSQPEILDYLKTITKKYKLYEHIKLQHEVKMISWNEELNKWVVRFVNLSIPNAGEEIMLFDILINAPGGLRVPYIPDEFKNFTGLKMHTAEWKQEIDIRNKNVAVIGSGASAVQVIPSIVDTVNTLHCYQRKPPYILPRLQFNFPEFIKTIFFYLPFLMWIYRCFIFIRHEILHAAFYPDRILHKFADKAAKQFRKKQLKKHKQLWDDLTPKYSFGCKRVIVSENYYSAMTRPNVQLHTNHIKKIDGQTIYTEDGSKVEVDVLILATGFRVHDYFSPMQVYGKDDENILKTWTEKEPRSFYGIVFSSAPNHFSLLGPNTALGHSSVVFMIECQVNFMINVIREMMKRKAKVVTIKMSAEDQFMDKLKVDLANSVWQREDCGSWYANPRGEITTLWGDNCTNYWRQTKDIDWSKFEFI